MQKAYMRVRTDCGLAEVTVQGPRGKNYKCPVCEELVEGEWHVVVRPADIAFRRHAHTNCIEQMDRQQLLIRLIPGRKY